MRFKGASLIDFLLIECRLSSPVVSRRASCQEAGFVKMDAGELQLDLYDERDHILTSGQSSRIISYVQDHLFFYNTSLMVYNFLEHIFHHSNENPSPIYFSENISFSLSCLSCDLVVVQVFFP